MKQNKYNSVHYWQNLMRKNEFLLSDFFKDVPIKEESMIVHSVLVNCYGGSHASWDSFPDVDAVIGYMKYVFLPTAYVEWCTRDDEDSLVQVDLTADEVIDLFANSDNCNYKKEIPQMREDIRQLDALWELPTEEKVAQLKAFSQGLHTVWDSTREIFFYCDVYESAEEVSLEIIKGYEEVDMLKDFEEEVGVSKAEWLNLAKQVHTNAFMRRRFIDLLNNNVGNKL